MKFSEKIIKLRKQSGLSQEEFADKINVSRQAVYKWETEQSSPDVKNIQEISKIFNVSVEYLLNDNFNEEETNSKTLNSKFKNFSKIKFFKIILILLILFLVIILIKFSLLNMLIIKFAKSKSNNAKITTTNLVAYDDIKHKCLNFATMKTYDINNKSLRISDENDSNNISINYNNYEKQKGFSLILNENNDYSYTSEADANYYSNSTSDSIYPLPENTWEILKISANPLSVITFNKVYNISITNHSYSYFKFNNGELETIESKEKIDNITSYFKSTMEYLDEISEEDFIKLACEDTSVDYNTLKEYIEK